MVGGIPVGNVQHLLQSRPGGAEEQEVICISMHSGVIVPDHASTARALEDMKKSVHIKTKKDR